MIWRTISVEQQPEITLIQWQIVELPDGKRHFNGYAVQNREGRVSSTIVDFDSATMRGRTTSGRIYELSGSSGNSSDGDYVLDRWLAINGQTRDTIKFITEHDA